VRVRAAISGLHRVLPLDYAGPRLTGAERDLARLRSGARTSDRDALVRTLNAVLDREPAAVTALRGDLVRRRDAAGETLAFEYAGRIQAEIEAIDWICAAQRATVHAAADATVVGWADGVAVRFTIRNGRMDGWTQRACRKPPVDGIDATPPEWIAFAQRNAQLAARLSAS
jgi:excinuclease ABC subunit C